MLKNVANQRVTFSLYKSGARIANPTIAAGDFTIDLGGAGQNNVATPPTSDAAGLVTWLPSQAETNADYFTLLANDVAGAEWEPLAICFDTRPDTSIASILANTGTIPAAADNADAVWNELIAGHAGVGSTGEALSSAGAAGDPWHTALPGAYPAGDAGYILGGLPDSVWASAARTLTQSAASVAAAVAGTTLTITRGDVFTASLTGLGNITGRTKLWFAVKNSKADADSASYLYIEETAGLTVVNGVAYTTIADGSIVVTNATTGALTITVKAAVTSTLTDAQERYYDIQYLAADGQPHTVTAGLCVVSLDVVRAIT